MSRVNQSQPDHYSLEGCLSLASLMQFREEAEREIPAERSVRIDLSGVEAQGSAALALLVHLVRRARQAGGEVRFLNSPERLRLMAEMAGLSGLLALEG